MIRSITRGVALLGLGLCLAADAPTDKAQWTPISDTLLAKIESEGKIPWPGKTGGITADPATGDVFMVVCGSGIYKSSDHGQTFSRSDDNHIGGRCETGAALQWDANGKRLACFMLDGKAGMTLDDGKTWTSFAGEGRGWDYGAVDWSADDAATILAMHHESDGQLFISNDAGQHWKKAAKDKAFNGVGVVDPKIMLTTKTDGGIFRCTDGGTDWSKVADFHVTSHVMQVYKGSDYFIAKEGLIVSADKGQTWKATGGPLEASFGPRFKDEKNMIVWGKSGILESTDGGETWKLAAMPPENNPQSRPEWFLNVGWDASANIFYVSRMSLPSYRFQR